MWVPPEDKDPILLHHPTRRSVGYFGAVRLRDGKFAFQREEAMFNAETFFRFLRYLRQQSARSGRRVIVIADNVRYHHAVLHQAWRRHHARAFRLLFLPPYSPDMNPIERVWKLVRRLATHNRYFPDLTGLTTAVELLLARWRHGDATLRRLCAIT
jgi:transposase